MRLGSLLRAKGFGELAKIRGIVYYRLSPMELKAFGGAFKKGVPNTVRRFTENFWRVVPPFIVSYMIYNYYEKEADRLKRKNPDDYLCDE